MDTCCQWRRSLALPNALAATGCHAHQHHVTRICAAHVDEGRAGPIVVEPGHGVCVELPPVASSTNGRGRA